MGMNKDEDAMVEVKRTNIGLTGNSHPSEFIVLENSVSQRCWVSSDWGEMIFTFQRLRFGLDFDINQLNKCWQTMPKRCWLFNQKFADEFN